MASFIRKIVISPVSIRVATVALGFISNIIINRSLGLALKGQYSTIYNTARYIQLILNLGICFSYPMLIKNEGEENAKKTILTVIWTQTIVSFIVSLVVIILYPSIRLVLIVILTIAMICNGQIVFIALIDNIIRRNAILMLSTLFFIICNMVCFIVAPGRLNLIVTLLIVKHIFEVVVIVWANRYYAYSFQMITKENIRMILKNGIPTSILVFLITCNYSIDIFMLNWMKSGDVQVGIYGVAYSLSNIMWIIPDAFKELIYNKTAKDDDYFFVKKCIYTNMGLCALICIGFAFFGKWFLGIAYGYEFTQAYYVSLVLFIGIIPMISFKLIHPIYINNGKPGSVFVLLLIAVIVNVITSWLCIPYYGALGAAIASVISYSLCGGLFFLKFKKDYERE